MEGNGGKGRGWIWRISYLNSKLKRKGFGGKGRELEGFNGYLLLRFQSLQSLKDLKGKLSSSFFLFHSPIQTRAISLPFLFPSIPFYSFLFPPFLFSQKLSSLPFPSLPFFSLQNCYPNTMKVSMRSINTIAHILSQSSTTMEHISFWKLVKMPSNHHISKTYRTIHPRL